MKSGFKLDIPKPCTQKWSQLTLQGEEGFCSSCNNTVVDFSSKTEDEIITYFLQPREHVCGRFNPKQLGEYRLIKAPRVSFGFNLLKVGMVSLVVLLLSKPAMAQKELKKSRTERRELRKEINKITYDGLFEVSGIVHDSDGKGAEFTISGANVILKGTTTGTVADANGQFVFPEQLKPGDVLQFSFIGYTTKEYVVSGNETGVLEIPMCMDVTQLGGVVMSGIYEVPTSLFKRWLQAAFKRS